MNKKDRVGSPLRDRTIRPHTIYHVHPFAQMIQMIERKCFNDFSTRRAITPNLFAGRSTKNPVKTIAGPDLWVGTGGDDFQARGSVYVAVQQMPVQGVS